MVVGATGFEPATSCSRSRRSTGLSYAPFLLKASGGRETHRNAPERTRTFNLLIRSQMLYPIELRALDSSAARRRVDEGPAGSCTFSCSRAKVPSSLADVKRTRPRLQCPAGGPAGHMGGTRLELVTSTMSTWRSNQLS
jgi:hypothetical protein